MDIMTIFASISRICQRSGTGTGRQTSPKQPLSMKDDDEPHSQQTVSRVRHAFASAASLFPPVGSIDGKSRRATPIRLSAIP
jgi:hypothetical protein